MYEIFIKKQKYIQKKITKKWQKQQRQQLDLIEEKLKRN